MNVKYVVELTEAEREGGVIRPGYAAPSWRGGALRVIRSGYANATLARTCSAATQQARGPARRQEHPSPYCALLAPGLAAALLDSARWH